MLSDNRAKELHDRTTRGQALSPEEQRQLEAWYAVQDRGEMARVGLPSSKPAASLQAQVDGVLKQLAATTQRIQELAAENEALRREIAAVRHQLAQRATLQPA
ncbi:MAG: hypothetical protein FJ279_02420 [Planctomycetes bacterium]|nr:hypothetical protein [Planctomycetota bacterium]MBM4079991.1 hypothetical protein [Planctomycetota bacterium]MBM4084491.1 hypothetical protein [Planctomycetota bacterium]